MGLENLKSAFTKITNDSQIGGRHGGLTAETPSQPPHPVKHSILDDINPYTNQFIYGFQYKNPNKGGLHGANIDFNGTPVLSTPFYEIENMTTGLGMIGHGVNFLSRLQGTNSYLPPVGRIPGFNINFDKGGYSFADGQIGNSKYIGIQSNHVFDTPSNIYSEFTSDSIMPNSNFDSSFLDFPNISNITHNQELSRLAEMQIHPIANDLVQLNNYSQLELSDVIDNFSTLPSATKLFDTYNYDPRIEPMYFGQTVPIFNINSYQGSIYDDNVGGLFNLVGSTSDNSKKYSTTFRTINIPTGFVITDVSGDVVETSGQVFTEGNINTGTGYPSQATAFEKFESAFALGGAVKYSSSPNTFILNTPEPNTPITNDFVSARPIGVDVETNSMVELGKGVHVFERFYNNNHIPTDFKIGPGNVKAKLSLQSDEHNSGYRGTEPYIVSSIGNEETKNSSRYWQFSRSMLDEERLINFMKSEAGLWFIAKQNLLGLNTRVIVENDKKGGRKAKGQRFKRWYSPVSTLAAAFRLGGGGFPNVLVDREFPLGEVAGLFGADINYSKFISDRKKIDRNYSLNDSITQPQTGLSFFGAIGESIAEALPGIQSKPKDPPKLGDKLTLMDYRGPKVPLQGPANYGSTSSTILVDNHDLIEQEKEKNGMPFYFRDMRTNKYLIFRAYLTAITENIQPAWNSETYVGRSEPVYVYDKTERDISFTLSLHAGTSSELEAIYKKMNLLTSLCYPEYKTDITFVNPSNNTNQQTQNVVSVGKNRMKPPLTMMRMGELYGTQNHELLGFVKSLTFSFPDSTVWETKAGKRVPKLISVAMSYQVVHASVPGILFDTDSNQITSTKFFGYSGDDSLTPAGLKKKIQPDIVYQG